MNDKFSERLVSVSIDYIPMILQEMFSQHDCHAVIHHKKQTQHFHVSNVNIAFA